MNNKKNSSFIEKFNKNDFGNKLFLGFFCCILLTVFFNFKQVKVDIFELNTLAPKYVVAQTNFSYPDEEATILLKQKDISEINRIYLINKNQISEKVEELEKFFIQNQDKFNPGFEDLVSDSIEIFENILHRIRFTNPKTIQIMKSNNMDTSNFLTLNLMNNDTHILDQEKFFLSLNKMNFKELNNANQVLSFVIDFFKKQNYILNIDKVLERNIKKVVEKNIPQQYSYISAGEQIIGQNEKIESKHISMMKSMKEALTKKNDLFRPIKMIGDLVLSILLVFIGVLYLKKEQPKIFSSLNKLVLVITIATLTLIFAKVMEYILLKGSSSIIEAANYPIILPFSAFLVSILFNVRFSLFFCTAMGLILAMNLAVDPPSFLLINFVTTLIVILSTKKLRKRAEVFKICLKSIFVIIPTISIFFVYNKLYSSILFYNIFIATFMMFAIGIVVVGLLPLLENIFDVLTDITLMEYMDPNNELLKRLTLEVPGSYQHSLVLANLAEAAALEINANGLFCRAATLYHDIGKLNNPNYFIENQATGINIHQLLTPQESAEVIISHVLDGENLAKKYRLPKQIIDVIKQHHGTTLVYYFYRKELELHGKDESKVNEDKFRYLGPNPKTKEAALIMIADAVEAASRSVDKISEKDFTQLVDKIVNERAYDGQFDDCCLTFEELKKVKKSIVKTLMLTRHVRIKYPERIEGKLNIYKEPNFIDNHI